MGGSQTEIALLSGLQGWTCS